MSDALVEPFLASVKASLSVLLTLSYGFAAAKLGLLSPGATREVSKLTTHLLLPFLIVTNVGPQLSVHSLQHLWVILLWSFLSLAVCHVWGFVVARLFGWPPWIAPATGLVNAVASPLLILNSLKSSGMLDRLTRTNESVADALDRAKSLVLVAALVQQLFAFSIDRYLMKMGAPSRDPARERLVPDGTARRDLEQDSEHVGLLDDYDDAEARAPDAAIKDLAAELDQMPLVDRPRWMLRVTGWLSPPLIGAIVALILGLIPPLHRLFFETGGALHSSVTESWRNVGELFVSLQMVVLGCLLQQQKRARPPLWPSVFVLATRFVFMPALSLGLVYATAHRGWYSADPIVLFVLILIPCGPTALLLSSLSTLVDLDVGPVSGFITLSYLCSPLIAFTAALAFRVVDAVGQR